MLRTCLGPLQGIFRNFLRPLHCTQRTSISTWNRYSSRGSKTDVSRFDRSNQLHPEGTTASKPRDWNMSLRITGNARGNYNLTINRSSTRTWKFKDNIPPESEVGLLQCVMMVVLGDDTLIIWVLSLISSQTGYSMSLMLCCILETQVVCEISLIVATHPIVLYSGPANLWWIAIQMWKCS
jgi:hypothetical protein